jgi:hypothetical protein
LFRGALSRIHYHPPLSSTGDVEATMKVRKGTISPARSAVGRDAVAMEMNPMTHLMRASQPVQTIHDRGVFDAEHTFPGMSTFRIYDCAGVLIERREVPTERVDGQTMASMDWTLEHHCPADPEKHELTCVSAHRSRPSLRLMASR